MEKLLEDKDPEKLTCAKCAGPLFSDDDPDGYDPGERRRCSGCTADEKREAEAGESE